MKFPVKITDNFILEPIMHTFGAKPDVCYADIEGASMRVRFGSWFDETFPIDQIASFSTSDWPWWGGLGVKLHAHGAGIVGSTEGVVNVKLKGPVKVHAVFNIECTQLWISLEDQDGFLRALSEATKLPVSDHTPF